MEELKKIILRYKSARNIQEKKKLVPILKTIRDNGYNSDLVFASIGEDAAAIQLTPNSEDLILITTDAILPEFIEKAPFNAGFSSIYVGIDDIIASGGKPIACSTTVSYPNEHIGKEIFNGILKATNIFQIPLIRGHTTTDSNQISLTSTIIGKSIKSQYLSGKNAQDGDFIGIIWDIEGKPGKANSNYWNTITMKSTAQFYKKREFISMAIKNKFITTCKDISNGGILGTIFQLLDYSHKGAHIYLEECEVNLKKDDFPYSLEDFLFLFLTSAFIVTGNESTRSEFQEIVQDSKMKFYNIGKVIAEPEFILIYKNQEENIM